MAPILIIDCQSSYSAAIYDYFEDNLFPFVDWPLYPGKESNAMDTVLRVKPSGIIITGSRDHLYDKGARILPTVFRAYMLHSHIPVLGICYGLQMIVHIFGGTVERNPLGYEHGEILFSINQNGFPLFNGLPPKFPVAMNHFDVATSLPSCFQNYGSTRQSNFGAIVYVQNEEMYPFFGLQFHPEKSTYSVKDTIFRNFLHICKQNVISVLNK